MPWGFLEKRRPEPEIRGHLVENDSDSSTGILGKTERTEYVNHTAVTRCMGILQVLARDRRDGATRRRHHNFRRSEPDFNRRTRQLVVAVSDRIGNDFAQRLARETRQVVAPAADDDEIGAEFLADPIRRFLNLLGWSSRERAAPEPCFPSIRHSRPRLERRVENHLNSFEMDLNYFQDGR